MATIYIFKVAMVTFMLAFHIGLIQVKEGFPRAGRAAPRDFLRAKPEGNPEEQPCQPEENPVHPDSFTWIYILFK